jgi:hypothetical protein
MPAPPASVSPDPIGIEDRSLSTLRANLLAAPIFAASLFLVVGLHFAVWGSASVQQDYRPSLWGLLAFPAGLVAHEGLHALGFRFAGAPSGSIRFGFTWRTLIPYAQCRCPVSVSGYRLAAALPALVLGVLPALWGLSFGAFGLSLLGALFIGFSSADLVVIALLRGVPTGTPVQDHPSRLGCLLLRKRADCTPPATV